jgi:hypothetical protein
MRVHDYVRTYAIFTEWHVTLADNQTSDAFLTVSTTKFVADFRPPCLSHQKFDEKGFFVGARDHYSFYVRFDSASVPGSLSLRIKLTKYEIKIQGSATHVIAHSLNSGPDFWFIPD